MAINVPALKEAFSDTAIATPMNLLISWGMLEVCMRLGMSAFTTSVVMTLVFFIIAVIRKYYIRLWFARRQNDDKR
jgi:hypothetical protein